MAVLEKAEEHPRSAARPWRRRLVIGFVIVLGIAGGFWAWTTFVPSQLAAQSAAPALVSTTNTTIDQRAADLPRQPLEQATAVPAAQLPAATTPVTATLPASSATQRVIVVAGTTGATLVSAPGREALQSLTVGAVLEVTGRNGDGTWLYASSSDGTTGWVATSETISFGTEKLAIIDASGAAGAMETADTTGVSTTAPISSTLPATSVAEVTTETVTTDDTGAFSAVVTVTGSRLNIRSGPGTSYAIVGKATAGETVAVLARNESSDWVQIALPDAAERFGWVAAAYVRLNNSLAELPVTDAISDAPALVVAAPTAAPPVQATAAPAAPVSTSAESAPPVTLPATPTPVAPAAPEADTVVLPTVEPESMSQVVTSRIAAQQGQTVRPASGLRGILVFQSSPGGTIYAYDLAAGRLWSLTSGFDPAISPDGQTVAFVRTAGENGIYLINTDGSNERLIFSGRNTLAAPKWSPDGSYILFTRGDEYKECRDLGRGICLTDKELLSQNPNFPVDDFPLIKVYESNLARVDMQGGNYRDIANLESARAADWNEAGIVYQSTAGLQITADAPDATTKLVAHDPYRPAYEDPDWQPNGGRIVYVGRQSNHREIFAVNPDGSGTVALTQPVTTLVDELPSNVAPAWSPDGQQIVFLSNRSDNYSAGSWRLWVMNADGSNQQPLPIEVPLSYHYGNEQVVSWGP